MSNFNNNGGSNYGNAAVKKAPIAAGSNLPSHTLKIKKGEEFITISGLWTGETSKGDVMLKGTVKDGDFAGTYYVFLNTPKPVQA